MNIKKAILTAQTITEILYDLTQDPKEEELLSELDYFVSMLNKSIYEGVN